MGLLGEGAGDTNDGWIVCVVAIDGKTWLFRNSAGRDAATGRRFRTFKPVDDAAAVSLNGEQAGSLQALSRDLVGALGGLDARTDGHGPARTVEEPRNCGRLE